MPILHIYSPASSPPPGLLANLCTGLCDLLSLPEDNAWALWHGLEEGRYHRSAWSGPNTEAPGPMVFLTCKSIYTQDQVRQMMQLVRDRLATYTGCDPASVYVAVQRALPNEVLVRGEVWRGGDEMTPTESEIRLTPIGWVRSARTEVRDDHWGNVIAVIELDAQKFGPESLMGLAEFSHIEVIFFMDRVAPEKIETGARHPRNRTDWPKVGVFSQRAKGRPNQLGVSRCRLLKVEGTRLTVQALDAVDGTPVLDIKPYMREFGPQGEVIQPAWSSELMADYYKE